MHKNYPFWTALMIVIGTNLNAPVWSTDQSPVASMFFPNHRCFAEKSLGMLTTAWGSKHQLWRFEALPVFFCTRWTCGPKWSICLRIFVPLFFALGILFLYKKHVRQYPNLDSCQYVMIYDVEISLGGQAKHFILTCRTNTPSTNYETSRCAIGASLKVGVSGVKTQGVQNARCLLSKGSWNKKNISKSRLILGTCRTCLRKSKTENASRYIYI